MMGLAYVYAEIGAIPFLSCFRKGDREVPKRGTPAHSFPEEPVHRLPVFLIQTVVVIKKDLRQFV